jgi:hypothetical protein
MDTIFNKPETVKRQLTDKHREALQAGRAKRDVKHQAKLEAKKQEQTVQAEKDTVIAKKRGRKSKLDLIKEQESVKANLEANNPQLKKDAEFLKAKEQIKSRLYEKLDSIDDPKLFKQIRNYFKELKIDTFKTMDDLKLKVSKDIEDLNK